MRWRKRERESERETEEDWARGAAERWLGGFGLDCLQEEELFMLLLRILRVARRDSPWHPLASRRIPRCEYFAVTGKGQRTGLAPMVKGLRM